MECLFRYLSRATARLLDVCVRSSSPGLSMPPRAKKVLRTWAPCRNCGSSITRNQGTYFTIDELLYLTSVTTFVVVPFYGAPLEVEQRPNVKRHVKSRVEKPTFIVVPFY